MDIFSFINSKDIREYLRSMDYQFNAMEAGWLVYQSRHNTLNEKIQAWNWIINNMQDCEVKERINCPKRDSMHKTLRDYMKVIENLKQEFYRKDSDAVYSYKYYYREDSEWCEDDLVYAMPEECMEAVFEDITEEEKTNFVEIQIKKQLIHNKDRQITLYFNGNEEVMDVGSIGSTDEEYELITEFFDGMWFAFPVPFVKGDVLIRYNEFDYPIYRTESGLLVMEDITPNDIKENEGAYKLYVEGHCGDSTDMNAWGYFQDEDGRIYQDVMSNYMDLEYYRGPYDGVRRLLKAISNFLKDEISLGLVLTTYRKVILDELAKDVMLTNWYTDEGLELAGLSDVVDEKKRKDIEEKTIK